MNKIIIISMLLPLFRCAFAGSYDFASLFGENDCTEGTMLSMGMSSLDFSSSSVLLESDIHQSNVTMATTNNVIQKNAVAQINEMAQVNNIKVHYELVSEEGPPHNKLFKVSLVLGNEYYIGEGTSLKRAKNDAASLALDYTDYPLPAPKESTDKILPVTPVMQLNNMAQKLGIKVRYEVQDENLDNDSSFSKPIVLEGNQKSYLARLNYSVYHPQQNKVSAESKTAGHPFTVQVHVGEHIYLGLGHTIQAAKHDGASKAIEAIKQEALDEAKYCVTDGYEEQCRQNKEDLKSPISLVYELSIKHSLPLQYDIIEESGKAHQKNFVTRCTLGDLVAEGSGSSKKESKRNASKNILLKKSQLPPLPDLDVAVDALKPKYKKKKKPNKLVKNKIDKLKATANVVSSVIDYFSDVPSNTDIEEGNVQEKSTKRGDGHKPHPRKALLTAKDELLRLSQSNGVEVQMSNMKNDDVYSTIISLSTKPPYVCLGQAQTERTAQEKASAHAIDLLYKLGYEIPIIKETIVKNIKESNLQDVEETAILDANEENESIE